MPGTDFVFDNLPLPASKSDLNGLPGSADATKWWAAADANAYRSIASSVRSAVLSGKWHGLVDNPTAPVSSAGGLALRSLSGKLQASENGGGFYDVAPEMRPEAFGAKRDGTTDDATALENCFAAAAAVGARVKLQRGVYRITRRVQIGARFVNENEVNAVTLSPGFSPEGAPSWSWSGSNAGKVHFISIQGEPGATVWGDFNPGTEAALFYWGIVPGDLPNNAYGEISGITFAGQDEFTAGVFNDVAISTASTSNQIGVAAFLAPLWIHDCVFRGLRRAVVMGDCFYSRSERLRILRCVDGYSNFETNAQVVEDIRVDYASGFAFTLAGQGFKVSHLEAGNCAQEINLCHADNVEISDCYFEDTLTRTTSSFGTIVGNGDGSGLDSVWVKFSNIHYDKHSAGYMLLKGAHVAFENCRHYLYDGDSGHETDPAFGAGTRYSFNRANDVYCEVVEFQNGLTWDPSGAAITYYGIGIGGNADLRTKTVDFNEIGGLTTFGPAAGSHVLKANPTAHRLDLTENGEPWRPLTRRVAVTATAGGTTTLTNTSEDIQVFTGSANQNVPLPDATTLAKGRTFTVINVSTGTLTVKDGSGSTVLAVLAGKRVDFTARATSTTAGTWDAMDGTLSLVPDGGNGHVWDTAVAYTSGHPYKWNSGGVNLANLDQDGSLTLKGAAVLGNGQLWALGTAHMTNGAIFTTGTGSPEGSVTANVSSIYLRSDGGAGTTLYVKESGSGPTGWVGK
jgi:hypothetical protein